MLRKLISGLARGKRASLPPPATASGEDARLEEVRRQLAAGAPRAALETIRPLASRPDAGAALLHLYGQVLAHCGEPREALVALRRAAALEDSAAVRADLGNVLLMTGEFDAAEDEYRRSLAVGASAGAWYNLGLLQLRRRRDDAAAQSFARALDVAPDFSEALRALGSLAVRLPAVADEVRGRCAVMLAADPDFAVAHEVLGSLRLKLDLDAEGAVECFAQASAAGGAGADLHRDKGIALQELGRAAEAIEAYDRALAINPADGIARWHRSLALLLVGRFEDAWPDYEVRLKDQARPQRSVPVPRWTEEALPSGRLLVTAEQGLGDEIMFASCIPDLVRAGAQVVLEAHPKLAPIFRRSFPAVEVRAGTQFDPLDWAASGSGIERYIESGSLPLRLRRTRADFPEHGGYLQADAQKVCRWRARVDALGGPAVGISWRGGTDRSRRRLRSPAFEDLQPLLASPGIHWVSLQYDARPEEIDALARMADGRLQHWQEAIDDYDETAALVAALDRTVTVCTAIVHLAGALGRPVIVMAPYAPEWRYGLGSERMSWYPSVRVLRQPARHAWAPLVARVADGLERRGSGHA